MKDTTLRHYQQTAVDKALAAYKVGHRGFLCGDKMGLGKTIVALKIAEDIPKQHNIIGVVCPAFLVPVWRREINARCDDDRDYKIALYSYSEISDPQILAHAKSARYDLIIFDEVHYAKSYKAQRTVATLGKQGIHITADRLLGLSGTWPSNDISDCYQWLHATKSILAKGGFEEFCREFAASAFRNNFGLQVSGFKPNARWYEHFPPVFIGREIDDVTDEIPEGLRIDFVVDIPKAVEQAEVKLFGKILDDPELMKRAIEAAPSFDALTEFRKMQGGAKVKSVIDYTLDAWESGEKKMIIFAYHTEIAEKIYSELTKKKLQVVLITGQNTNPDERDAAIQAGNKADEMIIVATIDSLKEGVTATGFTLTLFAEIDWRAWALEQAEGRTRRIGQKSVVRWVYFFFNRGVDKMMRKKIGEKKSLAKSVRATA
jgi:SNF2 family DNA or RNA helicase